MLDFETIGLLKKEFGFTDNHIFIYDYLFNVKEATAEDICRNTRVPKGRIYEFLSDLVEKGFLNEIYARPKRYFLKESQAAFRDALTVKERNLEEIERTAMRCAAKIGHSSPENEEVLFQLLSGAEEYNSTNLKDFYLTAEARVVGSGAVSLFLRDEHPDMPTYRIWLTGQLQRIFSRNVRVKILFAEDYLRNAIGKPPKKKYLENMKELLDYPNFEAHYSSMQHLNSLLRFQVFDDVVYIYVSPQQWVRIKSRSIAQRFAPIFDEIFAKAKPINEEFVHALERGEQNL